MDTDNITMWAVTITESGTVEAIPTGSDVSMVTTTSSANMQGRHIDTYHHGDLRRALVQAALELAAEEHHFDFSLREVARRAGVSHNAPYNHFRHKQDLLNAAAATGHDLLRRELTAAVAQVADPRLAILNMGTAYLSFASNNPALYRLMFSVAPGSADWRLAAGGAARTVLENLLRRGVRTGVFDPALARKTELQAAALYGWAVVHGLTMLVIDGLASIDRLSVERLAEMVVTRTLQGFTSAASKNGSTI
jgi:AcrR family transcriptional regulator